MLKDQEHYRLENPNLPHLARLIYLGIFNRYVDHTTQTTSVSLAIIERYVNTNSDGTFTRQKIRTAIDQLTKVGLIELVERGRRNDKAPVYFMPFCWFQGSEQERKKNAVLQQKRITQTKLELTRPSGKSTTQRQPKTQPKKQPKEQPNEIEVQCGLESNQQPKEQPNEQPKTQPLYTENKTYSDIESAPKSLNQQTNLNPPTQDEVAEFLTKFNSEELAEEFHDYYSARGWMTAQGQAIYDWQPIAKQWVKRNALNPAAFGSRSRSNQTNTGQHHGKPINKTAYGLQLAYDASKEYIPNDW